MCSIRTILSAILCLIFLDATAVFAQKPFQLLVIGFDYGDQTAYFCNGKLLNEINTKMVLVHTMYPDEPSVLIDSLITSVDEAQFDGPQRKTNIEIHQFAVSSGPTYRPLHIGADTAIVTGYYGQYLSQGRILCYARELTSPLLYGYSYTSYSYGSTTVDVTNYVLRDTLVDRMDGIYLQGTTQPYLGKNKGITIRSCGQTRIDSIRMDSDFSEFDFHNLPHPGQSIEDSFVITYDFHPNIIGQHVRPISIKLSDGRWLTWIFEYRVRPSSSVKDEYPEGLTFTKTGAREYRVKWSGPIKMDSGFSAATSQLTRFTYDTTIKI